MSSLPGGPADKAGTVYEGLWGVYAMVQVLAGHATALRIEPPRVDDAEFYLQKAEHNEYWQTKRQLLSQNTWTLQKLKTAGVLDFFLERTLAGDAAVFASITDAISLRMLCEKASDTSDFDEFYTKLLNDEQRKDFYELRGHLKLSDNPTTFQFLRAVEVSIASESVLEDSLVLFLKAVYASPPQTTLAVLQQFYLAKVHQTVTANDVESHLTACGIARRLADAPPELTQTLANITQSYLSGQRCKLIGRKFIPRQVATEWIDKLRNANTSLDLFITGAAGGGKSGCLFHIVDTLHQAGTPVLAFRLDRLKPVTSTEALGKELGLPDSPVVSLVRSFPGQPVVLVVDQLDFVSTTSGRHPDFFDTVASLCDEVRGLRQSHRIHLILACREFDFKNDHRFRQFLAEKQEPLVLDRLTANEVQGVVGPAASRLQTQQLELLRLPQNLSLFTEANLAAVEKPTFVTQKELFDAYWETKRNAIALRRPSEADQWMPLIERLTEDMSDRQELSVPKAILDEFPPSLLQAMVSEGVFTFDNNRYGFGHESFFDYCYARRAVRNKQEFAHFLQNDDQQLFRRAQLRQVLVYLREDDFPKYLQIVRSLLGSDCIRPHLKLLVLELIAAFFDPKPEEFLLLLPYIESELSFRGTGKSNPDKIASRAFDIFFASRTLFDVADRQGQLSLWLSSSQEYLLNLMTMYLRWQTEKHAGRVAELLEPFVGKSEEWRVRIRTVLEWGNLEKDRRYFDFFLRQLEGGRMDDARDRFASNGTFWLTSRGLAEKRPDWCAELAAKWLDRQVARMQEGEESVDSRPALNDDFGTNDLFASSRGNPETYITNVIPAILRAAGACVTEEEDEFPRDRIWQMRFQGEYIGLGEAYPRTCEVAFELIGRCDPQALRPIIEKLKACRLYTANHLLMHAYLAAPKMFADEALLLLADQPCRLHCGYADSSVWLSRCVIKECSPYCADSTFQKIEQAALNFTSKYERSARGYKYRGHNAYTLASALANSRITRETAIRLAEWQLKFGTTDSAPRGIRSYTVVSPIPQAAAEHMTDDQWLGAIAKHNTERGTYNYEHPERGGAWALAAMMQEFMKKEPDRFARLALRFPRDVESSYLMNVLYGARTPIIASGLKLDVARLVFHRPETACLNAALDLLGSVHDQRLPDDAIDFIRRMANHSDPDKDIRTENPPPYGGDALTHGINTVRGHAAGAIRDLLSVDATYLKPFEQTVLQLAGDDSPSVRAVACSLLFPLVKHDKDMAFRLMTILTQSEDQLMATHYFQDFAAGNLEHYLDAMRPYIVRMLQSPNHDVRQVGGKLAALARLYHGEANDLAEMALTGDKALRLGACEVAQENIAHPGCRSWCQDALIRLFNDPETEIRRKAAGCFWNVWKRSDEPLAIYTKLIENFLASPAFAEEPTYLLYALEDTRSRVPEVLLDICGSFIARCSAEARDIRTSMAADESTIGKLVFRAYAQLHEPRLRERALELIDQMCLEGLQSAGQHLITFER